MQKERELVVHERMSQGTKVDLAGAMRVFQHHKRVQFERCLAEPLQTITAILPGCKWSCLLLRIVLQNALSEVTRIYPR